MKRARLFSQFMNVIATARRTMILSALLLSIAAVLAARSDSTRTVIEPTSSAATKTDSENVITASSPANPATNRLPMVLITIRPTGFDPTEITVPEGRFLLAVENRSGLNVVRLRLTREGGGREIDWPLTGRKLREKLSLPAGNYVLTEANHLDWRSRVTVTP